MKELSGILNEATRRIPPGYFQVEIDGGDPIYRERVYCYELYHQMRCLWPVESRYYLNGELDKAAHPILGELGADHVKPDLLVHRPGTMNMNHAVLEVKSCRTLRAGLLKDLITLALFRDRVGYERAILLVFGYEADATTMMTLEVAKKMGTLPKIEVWTHQHPSAPGDHVLTLL